MKQCYIGLISGTSIDCVDATLVDCSTEKPILLAYHQHPINQQTRQAIAALCMPGDNEIDRMGEMNKQLGILFAESVNTLLAKSKLTSNDIIAIGSHGQTIRHRPPKEKNTHGFTLQIGDANIIAELTNITTVSDFRGRDMAAGGQGAPFAPAFHQAITPSGIETTSFLNLGGIANITLIHQGEIVSGFDTGPANGLMDAWILKHQGLPFDDNGEWARSGRVSDELLATLKAHPYFNLPAPKSTGREEFHLPWLESILNATSKSYRAEDVQATLMRFSCETIADAISAQAYLPSAIYCCGGGAQNQFLLTSLQSIFKTAAKKVRVTTTDELGIAADWVEACAFAWLAQKRIEKTPITLNSVTGASHACIAGCIYQA